MLYFSKVFWWVQVIIGFFKAFLACTSKYEHAETCFSNCTGVATMSHFLLPSVLLPAELCSLWILRQLISRTTLITISHNSSTWSCSQVLGCVEEGLGRILPKPTLSNSKQTNCLLSLLHWCNDPHSCVHFPYRSWQVMTLLQCWNFCALEILPGAS